MPNTVQHTPAPAPTKTEFDTLAEQIANLLYEYDTDYITLNSLTWNGEKMKYSDEIISSSTLGGKVVSATPYKFSNIRTTDFIIPETNATGGFRLMANTSSFESNARIGFKLLIMKT